MGQLPGVEIDIGGAGDHVPKTDIKIHQLKEVCCCVLAGLPFELPRSNVPYLVAYAVSRLNIRCTDALDGNVCPRLLFTGVKVNAKELSLSFGDYVETYQEGLNRTNTMLPRSIACIVLHPNSNSTGTWGFWNLKKNKVVRRSHWKKMVVTELIVEASNSYATAEMEKL